MYQIFKKNLFVILLFITLIFHIFLLYKYSNITINSNIDNQEDKIKEQQEHFIQHHLKHDIQQKPHKSQHNLIYSNEGNINDNLKKRKFLNKNKNQKEKLQIHNNNNYNNINQLLIDNLNNKNKNNKQKEEKIKREEIIQNNFIKQFNIEELDEISSWQPKTIVDFNKGNSINTLPEICKEIDNDLIKQCEGDNYYQPVITPTPVFEEGAKMNYSLKPHTKDRAKFAYYPREFVEPIITILTPYYNILPEILEETTKCVMGQSLQNFEWIIINDCSPNKTLAQSTLKKFKDLQLVDPRIKVIELEKNKGLPGARNAGIKISKGKYIVSLDPDDLIESTYLEKAVWFLETHKEFTLFNAWTIGFGHKHYTWQNGYHNGDRNLLENQLTVVSVMRTEVLRNIGGFNESLRTGMEDWDIWLKMADNGHWGYTMEEYHFWYRVSPPGKWADIDDQTKFQNYLANAKAKYKNAYSKGVPKIKRPPQDKMEAVVDEIPFTNNLKKCRPRVLILIPYMEVGGADQFNYNFAQGMVLDGWEVSIATTKQADNKWFPQFARLTPDIFVMPRFSKMTDQCRFLVYLIKSRQFDVVYLSNSEQAYHYLSYLRANAPGPAYLDYTHSETPKWKDGGYARYSFGSEKLLDRSIFASEHLRQYCINRGHNPNKTATVLIGIDSEKYVPKPENRALIRKELGFPDNVLVIVFVARLESEKQPEVFAEVLRRVDRMGYDFRAISIGGGLLLDSLNETIIRTGLADKVKLLGNIPNTLVSKYVSGSDVFFLPSKVEGISLAIYEAMSQGVCAVSAKVGGQAELVTPDVGYLVVPGTPTEVDEYTEIMADLAANLTHVAELGKKSLEKILNGFSVKDTLVRMKEEFCNAAIVTKYTTPIFSNNIFSKYSNEISVLGHEYERSIDELLPLWNQMTNLQKQCTPPPPEENVIRKPSPYPIYQPQEVYKGLNHSKLRVVTDILVEKQKVDKKMKIVLKDFQDSFIRRNPKFANKNLKHNDFLHQYNHGVENWNDQIPYPNPQQEYIAYIPHAFIGSGDSGTVFDWERIFLLKKSTYQMFTLPADEKCQVIKHKKLVSLLQLYFSFSNFIIDQLPKLSTVLDELLLDKEIKILVPRVEFAKIIMVDTLKFPEHRIVYFNPGPGWEECKAYYAETLLLPTPIPPGNPSRESLFKLREFFYKQNNLILGNDDFNDNTKKPIIMYCSRINSASPQRKVQNEKEIINTIKSLLPNNFDFYFWDGSENLNSTLVEITSRTKVIIGMTGSNLAPILVAKPNTIVIEFMHENPWLAYWSASSALELNHWMVPIMGHGHESNSIPVPIEELTKTLNLIFDEEIKK
ncbi:hypothetical protein DICPUDRAFT_47347 [Dictyostelium purpureum]|uniref:Glycosyltransferase 2-like domain-containing protein n=1 Tax=Dictyostelium purpureum TaxID=5786 RepID=F0ZJ44_DICPU|nr:uncharacterized protein DICPUDRAFT_47347 [Dictyostelium purpureum]EGC36045.1 hypothetical protein DICPUDRAFT_47347 [Dictyostelium purpureum]|eukprot:XP_003287420.1 hypothetical protein DICPUDRAFT_47347 [Dictyostelium purpureum]